MNLIGKVAVVTGAGGGGSGRAIARKLARVGAAVLIADIDDAGARETVRKIEDAGGSAAFARTNVAADAELEALFAFANRRFGGVDVLVNDASALPSGEGPLDGWFDSVQVDLLGTMRAILLAIPPMSRRGGGAIVNIASTSALPHGRSRARWPGYDAAKAGVIRLTTALAGLQDSHRIRVNCVVPAWIGSPHVRAFYDTLTPAQRQQAGAPDTLLAPDEVAEAVARLVFDETLAGRVLVLENGQPARLIPFADPGFGALE